MEKLYYIDQESLMAFFLQQTFNDKEMLVVLSGDGDDGDGKITYKETQF